MDTGKDAHLPGFESPHEASQTEVGPREHCHSEQPQPLPVGPWLPRCLPWPPQHRTQRRSLVASPHSGVIRVGPAFEVCGDLAALRNQPPHSDTPKASGGSRYALAGVRGKRHSVPPP